MLTFAELEASACTGLTRFLSFNLAAVTGEEAVRFQNRTISLFVDLAKRAGDCKAESFGLTFDSTAVKGNLDVE